MSRNLERVSSSSTSSSGGRRGPARPCGRVTTRTVIGPCGRAGATSARAGCFFVFGLDFSRACRCCLLCTCDLIYIRVHRSVCAPRHACCVLLRPATDDSGPFAQCAHPDTDRTENPLKSGALAAAIPTLSTCKHLRRKASGWG